MKPLVTPLKSIRPPGPAAPDSRRYVIVVLEGASDRPLQELGGRTPLAVAKTPELDRFAAQGRVGQVRLLPQPGRREAPQILPERALAQLLGVPWGRVPGRGVLEALGRGLMQPAEQAMARVEPLAVIDGQVQSVGVPELSPAELDAVCQAAIERLSLPHLRLKSVFDDGALLVDTAGRDPVEVVTHDPWSLQGQKLKKLMPAGGELGEALLAFVTESNLALFGHEVNITRQELGKTQVTHLWPWGIDRVSDGIDWARLTGFAGGLLTQTPWAKGLAEWLGLQASCLSGDSYHEICAAAKQAIEAFPVTVIHLAQAADASFKGNASEKESQLRYIDRELIGPLWDWMQDAFEQPRMLVTPSIGTHTGESQYLLEPVPFVMTGYRVRSVVPRRMVEADAALADLKIDRGHELIEYFLYSGTRH